MSESYAQKIYTTSGIAKEEIFPDFDVLHIGSGNARLPGSITMDILDLPEVDTVHNLDTFPWPCSDSRYDLVYAHNVLEHLDDIPTVMNEIHRVLKPGGRVIVTVPYFRCTDAFSDITHRHFFTSQSLDYFIAAPSKSAEYEYTKKRYTKIGFWYGWPHPSPNPLVELFKRYIHSHKKFYDRYLSLLFPAKIVIWELEVKK